jgi:tetratricopeptide (TPR) repeat protein
MRRAIAVTRDNSVAHANLGEALRRKGHTEEAIAHFREAVRIRPTSIEGHTNLGEALIAAGRIEEGLPHCSSNPPRTWRVRLSSRGGGVLCRVRG